MPILWMCLTFRQKLIAKSLALLILSQWHMPFFIKSYPHFMLRVRAISA